LRPTLGIVPLCADRAMVLRLRYYAALHIINRPFLLLMARSTDSNSVDNQVLSRSRTCIEACRMYLTNVVEMLDRPSPYLWTFSMS
jgi:hypothetical protein